MTQGNATSTRKGLTFAAISLVMLCCAPISAHARAPVPLVAPTVAPASQPMSLAQAVSFAADHNPAILRAVADAAAAGATLARDRALTLPQVSGELQSQLDKQSANSSSQFAQIGAAVQPNFSLNTAALRGDFNGLNLTNIYQARADKRAFDEADERVRMAREQSTSDVETGFYKLVEDVQLTQIAGENVNYNRALMAVAEVNYRAGRVAGLDQLKAQVAYTSALEQLSSAGADQEDARQNLAQLIGAEMDQQFAIPGVVPEPPAPTLDEKILAALALTNRPEVAIAQSQLDAAYITNALVDAPNRPNVVVAGAWGNQTSPTNNAQFINTCLGEGFPPSICVAGPSHFYEVSVVSTWTLPLLDWGTVHAGHVSAHRLIDSQRAALGAARQQALIDVDQAVRRLLVERENLGLARANVQVAKQAAQISAVQYKVGLASQTDVTAAQQSYLSAAKDLVSAQVGYVLAIVKLKIATGTLTEAI